MKEFKTLIERLDKKVIEAIEADRENYPTLVESTLTVLKAEYFAGDLILSDATRIFNYAFGACKIFNELEYRNLFKDN